MNKEKEYILTKEDFKGKIITFPKNISKKKFNKIKEKLKKIGFDNIDFVNYNNVQNVPKYLSSIYCVESSLGFCNCEGVEYTAFDEIRGYYGKDCEHISIKDFLAEPKETKLKTKFKNIKEFVSYLVDNGIKRKDIKIKNGFFLSKTKDTKLIKFSFSTNYESSWLSTYLCEITIGKYFALSCGRDYVSKCGKVFIELRLEDEQEYEEKNSFYYKNLEEIDRFLLDTICSDRFNSKKPLEFFIAYDVGFETGEKLKKGNTIMGKYFIEKVIFTICKNMGYKVSIELKEYEKSKIKIHDLFIEIDGTGINKYNIDKIYPDNNRGEIRLCIVYKDPNKTIWLYYKTKKTRDRDYEKLLRIPLTI